MPTPLPQTLTEDVNDPYAGHNLLTSKEMQDMLLAVIELTLEGDQKPTLKPLLKNWIRSTGSTEIELSKEITKGKDPKFMSRLINEHAEPACKRFLKWGSISQDKEFLARIWRAGELLRLRKVSNGKYKWWCDQMRAMMRLVVFQQDHIDSLELQIKLHHELKKK